MEVKQWVKIPDVLFFQEGPGVRNSQYTEEGIKLLNVANLVDGKIDLTTSNRYISESEAYGKYKHFLCDDGDFIVASSGIKVEYINKKMGFVTKSMLPLCMNTSTIRFKVLDKSRLNIKYFMYYLKSQNFKNQLYKYITGSAQLNFGPSHLKKIIFPLCDIGEQKIIVNNMDLITKIMDSYNEQLEKYDELIKARFIEMFGNESNPFDWPIVTVDSVADVQVGVVIKPAQYYADRINGIKTFRSLNVGEMNVKDTDWVYFSEEGNRKNIKSILKEHDLLIIRSGAPGTACVIEKQYEGCNVIDLIIAHPNKKYINPYYLCMFTNSALGKRQIDEGTGGAAQQHFNVGKYKKMKIFYPPMAKQQDFECFFKQVDKSRFDIKKSIIELEREVVYD